MQHPPQPPKKIPRNLFKFVSVLLFASVERVGVSRMRDCLIWLYSLVVRVGVRRSSATELLTKLHQVD